MTRFKIITSSKCFFLLLLGIISTVSLQAQTLSIQYTENTPLIDGIIDPIWDNFDFEDIDRNNSGTISSSNDLSGQYKVIWDLNNIYMLVEVKDDVFHVDNENFIWNEDGLEVFFDVGNDKSSTYGSNDFQFQFRYNDANTYEAAHNKTNGVRVEQFTSGNTVYYEISIPLATIGVTNVVNDLLIGFDIHINDDDNNGARDGKLAWYARADQSSNNPAFLGIAKFDGQVENPKADEPNFSHKRGMYDSAFNLNISSDLPNATIIYTLDGSNPKFSTTRITSTSPAEVMIDPTSTTNRGGKTPGVIVRALASSPAHSTSTIVTNTYLFIKEVIKQSAPGGMWNSERVNNAWPGIGTPQSIDYNMSAGITQSAAYRDLVDDALLSIPTYSLVTDYDDMFDEDSGIFMNALEDGWERPVSVEMIDSQNNDDFQIDAGIRIRGRFSRLSRNPKHSFRLMFRGEYGESDLEHPIFGDEGTDKFDRLDFRTAQNSSWQIGEDQNTVTFLKEVVARDIQGKMGYNYTKSRYCHLYLNGVYWGMFQIQERADKNFAKTYLGGDKDDYDVIKPEKDVVNPAEDLKIGAKSGNIDAAQRLWNKALAGFVSNEDYYAVQGMNPDGTRNTSLERLLDVENLIDYLLISFYAGSEDGPGVVWEARWGHTVRPNNFIGIFNRNAPDGFKWIVHDFEKTMFDKNEDFPLLENDDTWFSEDFVFLNPITIHRKLMANSEYRLKFGDRVFKHFENDGALTSKSVLERFNFRKAQIDMAVIAESARWGDWVRNSSEKTKADWENNVKALLENYVPDRTNIVVQQFKTLGVYSDLMPPKLADGSTPLVKESAMLDAGSEVTFSNPNGNTGIIYYTADGSDPRIVGGGLSPSAKMTTNNSNVGIDITTIVKARIKNASAWSPLFEIQLNVEASFDNLKITEIHYNPLVDAPEFLELKNIGTTPINLTGLTLSDGITYEFGSIIIEPMGFVVLTNDTVGFQSTYGFMADGEYTGKLKNSSENVDLRDAAGEKILSFEYMDVTPWPLSADGLGNSLVPIEVNPEGNPSDSGYWKASTNIGGSPGADDPESTIAAIIINEILADTEAPLVDAIELYNPTGSTVNVGGWFLTDAADEPMKWKIPAGTEIPSKGYLVINNGHYVGSVLEFSANEFGSAFSLSSHGEKVFLVSANSSSQLLGYSHGVSYGEEALGVSFGNHINSIGTSFFVAQNETSLGSENGLPRVGPVVISEIMYNPTVSNFEYIKLENISGESVSFSASDNPANTWKVEGIDFQFAQGIILTPGASLYIIEDTATVGSFRTVNNLDATVQVFNMLGGLSNSGETISLYKPAPEYVDGVDTVFEYTLIEGVTYDDKTPWPEAADGDGSWLIRTDMASFANDPAVWGEAKALSIDQFIDNKTNIYPNPTGRYINVELENFIPNATITIRDITGRLIQSLQLKESKLKVDLENEKNGVYVLSIMNDTSAKSFMIVKGL